MRSIKSFPIADKVYVSREDLIDASVTLLSAKRKPSDDHVVEYILIPKEAARELIVTYRAGNPRLFASAEDDAEWYAEQAYALASFIEQHFLGDEDE